MARLPETLVLRHLRAIRGDIAELSEDVREIKARLDNLAAQGAELVRRLGRIDDRWTVLENDPRFLDRVEKARASLRAGRAIRFDDV